jgi:N-acetylneuraminic acid mutarotase
LRLLRNLSLAGLIVFVAAAGAYLASTSVPCSVPDFASSPDIGGWSAGAAMPTPRSELAAAGLDGRIYVAGGLRGAAPTDAFEVYDVAAGAWHMAAALPSPLHHLALAGAGDGVFLTGGYSDLAFRQVSNAAWRYDPSSDAWSAVAPMPGPRAAHTMALVLGKLYVVGGLPGGTALWAYDPASDTWDTGLAPMPTAREHLAAAVVGDKLYVIGGRWGGVGNVNSLEVYHPATDTWQQLPGMPSARSGLTAGAIGSRIYVAGGEDPWARFGTACTFDTVEAFDTATGEWLRLDPLPTRLHGLTSAVVADRWHVIGGGTRPTFGTLFSNSDRIEIYSLPGLPAGFQPFLIESRMSS